MFGTLDKVESIVSELEKENIQSSDMTEGQSVADILLGRKALSGGDGAAQVADEDIRSSLNRMNRTYQIPYHRDITSSKKGIGKIIVLVKKVIRKILKFLILPIVEEQTAFNASTTQTMNEMYNALISQEAKIQELLDEIHNKSVDVIDSEEN